MLGAAGWLVDPGDPDDPLCDAQRVADELGIAVMTARRWMADGIVASTVAPRRQRGVPRRFARLSAVWACRDRLAERVLLPDLAEQLGLRYHELYNMVRRLGLHLDLYPGTREYQVTPEAAAALRAEHERVRALHRRSMKLAAAARQLKVVISTAALLVKHGDLDLDPETDSSGAKFVTRASVEAVLDRSQRHQEATCLPSTVRGADRRGRPLHRAKHPRAHGPCAGRCPGAGFRAPGVSAHC